MSALKPIPFPSKEMRQQKELTMMDKRHREEKKRYEYEIERLREHMRQLNERVEQMVKHRRYILRTNRRLLIENNILRTNIMQDKNLKLNNSSKILLKSH